MKRNSFDEYLKKELAKKADLKKDFDDAAQAFSIAQQLYDLRKNKGLTQVEFAKLIGVSQPNIARLESGDYRSYSLRTLNKAVKVLGSGIEIRITPLEKTQTVIRQWIPSVFQYQIIPASPVISIGTANQTFERSEDSSSGLGSFNFAYGY